MNRIRTGFLFVITSLFTIALSAEAVAPSFFREAPVFTERLKIFSAHRAWVLGDHVLNQNDSSWFGHTIETGVDFTLASSRLFTLRFTFVELFQFRVHPETMWMLWGRGLLSNMEISADFLLPFFTEHFTLLATIGFRHDCKHDIDAFYGRSAVHDALTISLLQQFPPFAFSDDLSMRFDLRFGGELYTGQIFQVITPEPNQTKFLMEGRWIPLEWRETANIFLEGRLAVFAPTTEKTKITIRPGSYVDYRFNAGVELRAGIGRLRVWYSTDYTTDPWINNNPEPAQVHAVGIGIIFNG